VVEYRYKRKYLTGNVSPERWYNDTYRLSESNDIGDVFTIVDLKIDGVIYSNFSEKFEQALMWEKLKRTYEI